jgi:hypothetical protein
LPQEQVNSMSIFHSHLSALCAAQPFQLPPASDTLEAC